MEFNPDNFWSKVEKTDHCWIWTASLNPGGYGRLRAKEDGKRVMRLAHRISYQLRYGTTHALLWH